MYINAPQNLQELQQRCQQIAGKTIGHLAEELQLEVPGNLMQAKGWVGQLIEMYLGATASSKAQVDFPQLGIELKTIPINQLQKPLESTYVCTLQTNEAALNWHDSWVYRKLKHVLWVPLLSNAELAIDQRVVENPILWQLDAATEEILRTDWEELMEIMQLGYGKFKKFLNARKTTTQDNLSKICRDFQCF